MFHFLPEMAELFIRQGVKVDVANSKGTTIFHIAADNHNLDLLNYLLESISTTAINAKNHLGRTPLHNVVFKAVHQHQANLAITDTENTESRFRKLIQNLMEKGADINIKDQKGESPIMLAVTNPALLKILLEFNADVRTENTMGRQLIHMLIEKMILFNTVKSNTSQIIEFLQSHIDINHQDIWKITPLHVAVSSEKPSIELINILLEHRSDVKMRDSFGFLPISYAVPHPDVFSLLWDRSLPHITDNDFKILRILAHCHSLQDTTIRDKIKGKRTEEQCTDKIPQNFIWPSGWQSNVDLNEWSNDKQTFDSFEDFHKDLLNSLQRFTYVKHTKIVETLTSFIEDVLADVSRRNPLMACEFRLSGSENEGTKIKATDEMDALSVLTSITFDKFKIPTGPGHPVLKEFVNLVCKEEYREELRDVLDEKFQLSRDKVYQHYSEALSAALANPALWAKYPSLQRITNRDIVASNRTITPMTVMWHDDVYPLLVVDVDMVLAMDLPQVYQASWASDHPLLNKVTTLIVPKWKSTAPEDEVLLEMGVSHWKKVFSEMPPEMKEGYRMAKVVKEICPSIKNENGYKVHHFLTSYMFKMAIVELYATVYVDCTAEPPQPNSDDRDWALAIYKHVEKGLEQQNLSSFFIPDYNLLYDAKFAENRTLAIAYSRLCQKMLTPEAARRFHEAYMGLDPEPVISGQSMHQ